MNFQDQIKQIEVNEDRFKVTHDAHCTIIQLKAPWLMHAVFVHFSEDGNFYSAGEVFGTPVENRTNPLSTEEEVLKEINKLIS